MLSRDWKLVVVSIVVVVLTVMGLEGCGGGGGGGGQSGPPTQQASGQVKTAEIGGTGLKVVSTYQESAPVDESGSFTTKVSQEGAQLLFLLDSNGALRGLSLSIPQRGRRALLTFDGESTALSLLFLTPGILSVKPEEAQSRIEELKGLTSFSDFINFLKQELPQKGISEIVKEEGYKQLLGRCVEEWLQKHTAKGRGLVLNPTQVDYFQVSVKDQSNPSKVIFELKNGAFRFVNVYRRVLDGEGKEIKVDSIASGLNSMGGAKAGSWGSIFSLTFTDPTIIGDAVNFLQPQIGVSQYWVRGPGWAQGSESLPSSITDSDLDAWGLTVVYYFVLPIVDLCDGSLTTTDEAVQKARDIWKGVSSSLQSQMNALIGATDEGGRSSALCDIVAGVLNTFTKTVLSYVRLAFTPGNTLIGTNYYGACHRVSKVEVKAYGGADVSVKGDRR